MIAMPLSLSGAEEKTTRFALSIKIQEIMERYKDVAGITDVTETLSAKVDEENLAKATQEIEGLHALLSAIDASDPNVPAGASMATFSRGVFLLKRQVLIVYIKNNPRYCEAFVQTVSGM